MFFFVGYALIGLVAGLVAERYASEKGAPNHQPMTLVWIGIAGAIIGGSLSLALFRYGRSQAGSRYAGTRQLASESVPADWLTLIVAMMVAALLIAMYKLVKSIKRE